MKILSKSVYSLVNEHTGLFHANDVEAASIDLRIVAIKPKPVSKLQ